MYTSFDFQCTKCSHTFDDLVQKTDPAPACPQCGGATEKLIAAPVIFQQIVPDYPGSWKHKAGYQHHIDNRPREKIGVSVPDTVKKGE